MPTLTTLVSFNGDNGQYVGPYAGLIIDSAGDLFSTTPVGVNNTGMVFEITKTSSGYASTPTPLVSFS